jgi:hypothetical protein
VTLYFAALQTLLDGVKLRFGSIGGMAEGPRNFERAYFFTLRDLADEDVGITEADEREAFMFGICLADAERVLTASRTPAT